MSEKVGRAEHFTPGFMGDKNNSQQQIKQNTLHLKIMTNKKLCCRLLIFALKCRDALTTRQKLISQDYKVSYSLAKACKIDLKKHRCNLDTNLPRAREARLSYLLLCLEAAVHRGEQGTLPIGFTLPLSVKPVCSNDHVSPRSSSQRRVSGRDAGLQTDAHGGFLSESRDRTSLSGRDWVSLLWSAPQRPHTSLSDENRTQWPQHCCGQCLPEFSKTTVSFCWFKLIINNC